MIKHTNIDTEYISQNSELLYRLQKKINSKYGFLPFEANSEMWANAKISLLATHDVNEIILLEDDLKQIGYVQKWQDVDWGGNPEIRVAIFSVTPNANDELFEFVADYLKHQLQQHYKITLITYNHAFDSVCDELNGQVMLNEYFWSLKREDMNPAMYDEWIDEVSKMNSELRSKLFTTVPDDLLEEYSKLFKDTLEDMPENNDPAYIPYVPSAEKQKKRNEEFVKNGIAHLWCGLFNESNKLVGMSNVRYKKDDPKFVYQFMISTQKDYRGRKLGRWLYAEVYKQLMLDVPELELVWLFHHENNVPAYSLSIRTGYQKGYAEVYTLLTP